MADNTHKMLQMVLDGQGSIRKDIKGLDEKLSGRINRLDKKIDGVEERLTKRIDKIGVSVAKLQDDAPTVEEFDKLEVRVKKVEVKVASV